MKPIFNGHTWIVAIISILTLASIGIYTEYELFKVLIKETADSSAKIIETGGIAFIPYSVVKGIIKILERLTKIDKSHTHNDNH